MVTIDIVEDSCHSSNEEVKISSSSLRKRLLGMLLREPKVGTFFLHLINNVLKLIV